MKSKWSEKTSDLIKELNEELRLNNYNWHKYKGDNDRRAAELIAVGLSQLINKGKASEIEDLLQQALKWVKREVKDPGCPNH
tara:strand:- start:720 stop:965 length:246 start_codon:yes stop_codon:yes gene_type:complete